MPEDHSVYMYNTEYLLSRRCQFCYNAFIRVAYGRCFHNTKLPIHISVNIYYCASVRDCQNLVGFSNWVGSGLLYRQLQQDGAKYGFCDVVSFQ